MKIILLKDYDEIADKAAEIVLDIVKNNHRTTLGLATGSSPLGLYERMIKDHKEKKTTYKNVATFNLDEYYGLSSDHHQSYAYFMNEKLFNHIDIDKNNINIPSGHKDNPEEECERYNSPLEVNKIDVQILGIGSNGHIGFNEPGTSFDSLTHVIKLDDKTIKDNARFFDAVENVPTHAITMGIKNIMQAKKIILIAAGANKAEAISRMVKGKIDEELPASILQLHPDVTVLLDSEAASKV